MTTHNSKLEKYLSSQRVAETLEISHETVNKWLREGILNGLKVGQQWRVKESELSKFLANLIEVPQPDCEALENKKLKFETRYKS